MRFKLIPQMVEAPWVLRAAVSSTPCILGQKIVQRYFQGPGYLEVDLHVGSSAIADNIVSLCRVYSNAFSINMGKRLISSASFFSFFFFSSCLLQMSSSAWSLTFLC